MPRINQKGYAGVFAGNQGFTLIELMIVVAVIAIIAAIAFPSYQNHVIKTRRGAATSCALVAAQYMERYYTTNLTYVDADLPASDCQNELQRHYAFAIDASDASSYTISATPQNQQADKDTKCGTMSITQTGAKDVTGTADPSECW